jgi:hypothetical protein
MLIAVAVGLLLEIRKPGNDLLSHPERAVPSAKQGVNFLSVFGRAPPEGTLLFPGASLRVRPRAGRVLRCKSSANGLPGGRRSMHMHLPHSCAAPPGFPLRPLTRFSRGCSCGSRVCFSSCLEKPASDTPYTVKTPVP